MKAVIGLASLCIVVAGAGCDHAVPESHSTMSGPDLAFGGFGEADLGGGGMMMGQPNNCGDFDPQCQDQHLGPDNGMTFPLGSDPMKDPNEKDDGVGRDQNGWLGLSQSHAAFDYLWI